MAMNISDRKRRTRMLESSCTNWLDNTLAIRCTSCGNGRLVQVGSLRFRQGETMGSLIGRLKCRSPGCKGGRLNDVMIFATRDQGGSTRVAFVLFGEGAAG